MRLDNATTGTVVHAFINTTGKDIIDCGSTTNFTFVDQVHAADKPQSDGTDAGVEVQGGSGNTLRLEAGVDDTDISVTSNSTVGTYVQVADAATAGGENPLVGYTHLGSGVDHLTIRTNDVDASDYHDNAGGDGTNVYVQHLVAGIHLLVDTGEGTYDKVTLGDNGSIGQQATVMTGAGNDQVYAQATPGDDGLDLLVDFGQGTGSGDGLGRGNYLEVNGAATAQLKHVNSSADPIVVDNVRVRAGGTFIVSDEATIGDLEVATLPDQEGIATIDAPSTINTFGVGNFSYAYVEAPCDIGDMAINSTASVDFTGTSATTSIDTLTLGHQSSDHATVNLNSGSEVSIGDLETPYTGVINAADTAAANITNADVSGDLVLNLTTFHDTLTSTTYMSEIDIAETATVSGTMEVENGGLLSVGTFDAGSGTVNVHDDVTMTIENTSEIGTFDLTTGSRTTFLARGTSPATTAADILTIDTSLNLGNSSGNPTGTLDLEDNDLIVKGGDVGTGTAAPTPA